MRLELIDEKSVDQALARFVAPTSGVLAERVNRLAALIRRTVPESRRATCATCGLPSDVEVDACPFCGDGAALVQFAPGQVPFHPTPAALDEAVAEVLRLKRAAVWDMWDLGQVLMRVHDERLFMARHKSWEAFVHVELGMTVQTANDLRAAAQGWPRQLVAQLGPRTLRYLVHAPEDQRPQLLALVRARLGPAATEREVKRLGFAVCRRGPYDRPKHRGVTLPAERMVVPLTVGLRTKQAAHSLDDAPVGVLTLDGKASVRFAVVKAEDGALSLVVEPHRKRRSPTKATESEAGDSEPGGEAETAEARP